MENMRRFEDDIYIDRPTRWIYKMYAQNPYFSNCGIAGWTTLFKTRMANQTRIETRIIL